MRSFSYRVFSVLGLGVVLAAVFLSFALHAVAAPATPTGYRGAAESATSNRISWNASAGAIQKYNVYRNGALVGSPFDTTFLDTGLIGYTWYSYSIEAVDTSGGVSPKTPVFGVRTLQYPAGTFYAGLSIVAKSKLDVRGTPSPTGALVDTQSMGAIGVVVGGPTVAGGFTWWNIDFATRGDGWVAQDYIAPNGAAVPLDTVAPTAPTGLKSVGVTATTISLQWNASTDNIGVTGYNLYRNGSKVGASNTTSFVDSGLTANTLYSYAVTAYDARGNESTKNVGIGARTALDGGAAVDTTAPSVPGGLSSSGVTTNSLSLSWSASTDNVAVTGYKLYRDGVQIGTSVGTTYSDSGLAADTNYVYSVSAFDAVGNTSAQSSGHAVRTSPLPDTIAPTIPTGLYGNALSETSITITWVASTDAVGVTGYTIYRGGVSVGVAPANATSYTDSGLVASTPYSYTVTASDVAGNVSGQSDAAVVTTKSPPNTPPSTPTNVTGYAESSTALSMSWSASSDNVSVSKYNIYLNGLYVWNVAGLTFRGINLTPDTDHVYTVTAVDGENLESAPSAPITIRTLPISSNKFAIGQRVKTTTSGVNVRSDHYTNAQGVILGTQDSGVAGIVLEGQADGGGYVWYKVDFVTGPDGWIVQNFLADNEDVTAPSVPDGFSTSALTTTSVTVSWTPSTDDVAVVGYTVFRDGIQLGTVTTAEYADAGLSDSTAYSYRVTAFDAKGNESAQSAAYVVTTPAPPDTTPPSAPTNLTGTVKSSTYLIVRWNAATDNVGVTKYNIYRNDVYVSSVEGTTVSDINLAPDTDFIYTITAVDAKDNESVKSAPLTLHTLSASANAFTIGQHIKLVQNANVRAAPLITGTLLTTQRSGTKGVILEGPRDGSEYVWWKIDYETGADGWTAQGPIVALDVQAPSVPSGVSGTSLSQTSIQLSWTASTDNIAVTGYRIYRNGTEVGTTGTTAYTDTALTSNTQYSYTIAAFDAAGNLSAQSAVVVVKTESELDPNTVVLPPTAAVADIQAAVNQLTTGGKIIFPANKVFTIAKAIDVNVTSRSIEIDLNGSVLKAGANDNVIKAYGTHSPLVPVALSKDANGKVVATYSTSPGVTVGQWVKIVADDNIPGGHPDSGKPPRLGQAMQVASVNGTTVTFNGTMINYDLYKTNIRASKYTSGSFTLRNGTIVGDQAQTTWKTPFVQISSVIDPLVERMYLHNGNTFAINFTDTINAKAIDCVVKNLKDDPVNGYYGSAVKGFASLNTYASGLYAEKVRHASDNNTNGIDPNNSSPYRYGSDIAMAVDNSFGAYTTAATWDWHSECVQCTINNVIALYSYTGLGVRGIGNSASNFFGLGNVRGIEFLEWGVGDARNAVIDNMQQREIGSYYASARGNTYPGSVGPKDNVMTNSSFQQYPFVNLLDPKYVTTSNTTVTQIPKNSAQDDVFTGTAQNDTFLGGVGNDALSGETGNDYLMGGAGADSLFGGLGRDRFVYFLVEDAGDTIIDFIPAVDLIDLAPLALHYEWPNVNFFANGYIKAVQSGSDTLIQVDIDGGGNSMVTLATLKNVTASQIAMNSIHMSISPNLNATYPIVSNTGL